MQITAKRLWRFWGPVDWCTIGTMYHWASKADNIKEMMDYIPHVSRYIPTYTYRYLYIHSYTCIYLHIHSYTCIYPTHPTWKGHISATSEPINQSQRTDLITAHFRQIVLVFGTWNAFDTIWQHSKKCTDMYRHVLPCTLLYFDLYCLVPFRVLPCT